MSERCLQAEANFNDCTELFVNFNQITDKKNIYKKSCLCNTFE